MTPITADALREHGWKSSEIWATKGRNMMLSFVDKGAVASNLTGGCRWNSFGIVHTMEELAIVEEIVNRLYRQ